MPEPVFLTSSRGSLVLDAPVTDCIHLQPHDVKRLEASGLTQLSQLTSSTAARVWRRVGGYYVREDGLVRRGKLFLLISDMLATRGLCYADCDPLLALNLTVSQWQAKYEAPPSLSKVLVWNEVVGRDLLLSLNEDEVASLHRLTRASDMVSYQKRLRAVNP